MDLREVESQASAFVDAFQTSCPKGKGRDKPSRDGYQPTGCCYFRFHIYSIVKIRPGNTTRGELH